MNNELRWQQRFENFEKVYLKLNSIIDKDISGLSEFEQMGVVQVFEILTELSWKLIKDYLTYQDYADINTPRNVIRQAFVANVIIDAETWMLALQKRELINDSYKEKVLRQLTTFIFDQFYPIVTELYQYFKAKL